MGSKIFPKAKRNFVMVLFLFISVFSMYYYFYIHEHVISSVTLASTAGKGYEYTLSSKCIAVDPFTFAPYVSLKLNSFEIITSAVNQGYDTVGDCMRSSVRKVEFSEDEGKIRIYMVSGQIKDINVVYDK